jgi:hypothetical protein
LFGHIFFDVKLSLVAAVDVKTGDMVSGGESGMERRFRVEAKTYFFSTKASQLRLEERRKGFLGLILVDRRRAAWLAATVEEASRSPALADFDKISSEGRKSLSVRGGSNKGGRFLEVVASVDDDRKGIIWIPEARSGRGWRRFTTEIRSLLAALESAPGFSAEESSTEGKVERSPGFTSGRSYADAVRSPAGEVDIGLQLRSTQDVDLFPVASSFELGNDGWEASSARVCFDVETANLPLVAEVSRPESSLKWLFSTAAADEERGKMMKEGIMVIRWLWKLLGLAKVDLDRVLDGLQEKPNGCMGLVKLLDSGREFGLGEVCGLDSGMKLGLKPGSVDGLDSDPAFGSGSGSFSGPAAGPVSGSVSGPDPGPRSSVWGPVSSGQGTVVVYGVGSINAAIVGPASVAGDGSAAGNGAGSVFGDSSAAGDGSSSAPGAAAGVVVDGSEITSPVPAKTAVSDAGSNSGDVGAGLAAGDVDDGAISGSGSVSGSSTGSVAGVASASVQAGVVGGSSPSPAVSELPVPPGRCVSSHVDLGLARLVGPADAGDGPVSAVPPGYVSVPVGEGSTGSASMVSVECKSTGSAIGAVTEAKPLACSARKETRAWFIGWLRAGLQHDEKLLAKLDVIVKRTSRVKLDVLSPDRTTDLLLMREELESMDVESRQVVAISWLNLQAQE